MTGAAKAAKEKNQEIPEEALFAVNFFIVNALFCSVVAFAASKNDSYQI